MKGPREGPGQPGGSPGRAGAGRWAGEAAEHPPPQRLGSTQPAGPLRAPGRGAGCSRSPQTASPPFPASGAARVPGLLALPHITGTHRLPLQVPRDDSWGPPGGPGAPPVSQP